MKSAESSISASYSSLPLFSGSMALRISPEPAIPIGLMYETRASQMQSNAMIPLPAFFVPPMMAAFSQIFLHSLFSLDQILRLLFSLLHTPTLTRIPMHACIELSNPSLAIVMVVT